MVTTEHQPHVGRRSRSGSARQSRRIGQVGLAAALTLVALLSVACGDDEEATPTTAQASRESTTTVTTDESETKDTIVVDDPAWAANATEFRGQDGTTHSQECPPNPDEQAGSVWGAGTYTDDSSICTAAVQSGLITFAEGGTVTFEIAPGQDSYDAGTANGVTSSAYASWEGSFTFPDAPPGSVDFAASAESWSVNVSARRGQNGTEVTVNCSADGTAGSVWGSGPYTDDSSVCTAGVHSGAITLADGGAVTVEIQPGQESYEGSTANGVTSSDYGGYGGSFVVVTGG